MKSLMSKYSLMFKKITPIPNAKKLIDIAFSRSRKQSASVPKRAPSLIKAKRKELMRVNVAYKELTNRLKRIVHDFPPLDELHPFYYNLINALVDVIQVKKALASLDGASQVLKKIYLQYRKKISGANDAKVIASLRKAAFGRFASVIKKLDDRLIFLQKVRNTLKSLPSIDPNLITIVVAGAPNVGKSTFVEKVSSAKPEIDVYPFTTKNIIVGHFEESELGKIQIIDTPGLLDRPLEKRNKIELKAIMAIKYLAAYIIFILDPSETCGMSIKNQLSLYKSIMNTFKIPIVPVLNKVDLASPDTIKHLEELLGSPLKMSALHGDNVDSVMQYVIDELKSKRRNVNKQHK